jgi:beta-1,2-mannobiose phosphorylase / 1,2-beta-oligomannan phosphorylase
MLTHEGRPDSSPAVLPQVRRLRDRPIVDAGAAPGYGPVFNAGLLHHDGMYHLFTRAVRPGYRPGSSAEPRYVDYISDIVVFTSVDGHEYDYGYVLARSGVDGTHCFEDPRVQWVSSQGSEHLVMTYTDVPAPESGLPWRIGARRLRWDGQRFELEGPAAGHLLGPSGKKNKDAVVFTLADGRVALIHRIDPDMQLAVFDDLEHLWYATDADYWDAHLAELQAHTLIKPGQGVQKVGGGAPPLLTDAGFLLFYHERLVDGTYTMNLALLDEKTGEVISKLPRPLLEPELSWEIYGDVNRVIFVQGVHASGDEVYLTYGAADRCVGAATGSVSQLLDALAKAAYDE